ncbi:hypothetical protein LJC64_02345 [Ruminococcaceae bacterium OttesenSCG-928-A11]|nr:hypothetical protein [Ruminococcaceae bacterium OttesenSCG-928-A11]
MNKKVKDARADELLETIHALEGKQEFNIAADLRELQKQFNRMTKPAFKKVLAALLEKYTTGEAAMIHEVLVNRCREGDLTAIRLYKDMMKDSAAGSGGDEVVIVNDLG